MARVKIGRVLRGPTQYHGVTVARNYDNKPRPTITTDFL